MAALNWALHNVARRCASTAAHPLKYKHLASWTLVKRARFNAAKRLERKSSAGIVTLAIVALYGGLISVFNLMFKHRVGADMRDVLEYVAVVSSWLTLIIGLTEQHEGSCGQCARAARLRAATSTICRNSSAATPIHDERHAAAVPRALSCKSWTDAARTTTTSTIASPS